MMLRGGAMAGGYLEDAEPFCDGLLRAAEAFLRRRPDDRGSGPADDPSS